MPAAAPVPVVFVHGLWLHATSWAPWVDLFAARGFAPVAPGWPGEPPTAAEARAHPEAVAGLGIGDVTDSYAEVIAGLPSAPVVVGHSFGGLVAQKLHGMGLTRACVALSPAQFRGNLVLPPVQLRTAWPVLSRPGLRTGTWAHSPDSFARGFASAVPREESDRLYEAYAIPSPARPLFQAGLAAFTPRSEAAVTTRRERGPVLLVAAGRDRTVPAASVRAAARIQRRHGTGVTELVTFPDRGHSLGADAGWQEVAATALDFLARHGVGVPAASPAAEGVR
ncbi:alpha-beta hydrolase superfamily lysophospholipase [Geodermatophilus normandii]|uniref:Alpha-beta hydrolase superfamily lysophospholipase n=1 Tax=Geodermatophilus normandii TaxID=1137989 RepID=A0A317QDW5_9ACTN|nr:alpha/beta fold hydrolase [Geodermatophilus normandii]PWW21219.1 alpha-beta hydrolase superfamily lysophospholipase [Geodermatophilus normandii]